MRKRVAEAPKGLYIPKPVEVELERLNFATYNPRRISRERMAQLKASLVKHGMVLNLVVQLRSDDGTPLVLIGGHQRVTAMRELYEEWRKPLPRAMYGTVLDVRNAEAKQLNVALNNIEADFDDYMLGDVLASIRGSLTDADVAAMGFTMPQVDNLVAGIMDPLAQADALEAGMGDLSPLPQVPTLSIAFERAEDRDAAKAVLKRLAASGVNPGVAIKLALEAFEKSGAPGAKRRRRPKAA